MTMVHGARKDAPIDTGAALDQRDLKDEAADSIASVKEDVESLVSQANDELRKLTETAKTYGSEFAQDRKAGTADTIFDIAQSLRQTGGSLSNSPNIREIVDRAADNLEDIAATIHSKSFSDLYRDAEDFARERPLVVAAGAAVLGLLAARLLKSSGERREW